MVKSSNMQVVADLHLHSKYSRAVSQQMVIPEIARWAKLKGIDLMGTSDWTHPLWLRELRQHLKETGNGVYEHGGVKFILTTEISSIYTQGGKGRRIHNLLFAPSLEIAEKINAELRRRGANLLSDGRPIVGLTSQEICELVFTVDKNCLVVPCHAWTPWFALFGSKSGFDALKECYGQFSDQIYGVETGLSSSPDMNWRIKELDSRSILSNSDAHSPAKLGREATIFKIDKKKLNYSDIVKVIKEEQIAETIEFYPEEGKYHYTGHRNCDITQSPEETKKLGATCPVCGKPLTVGVMHRVEQLANWPAGYQPKKRPKYKMLVPLLEILSEALSVGVPSQAVQGEYQRLVANFGSEFNILLRVKSEELAKISNERVAEGILRVRNGQLTIKPGYDGVFGEVKIWPPEKEAPKKKSQKQMSLF